VNGEIIHAELFPIPAGSFSADASGRSPPQTYASYSEIPDGIFSSGCDLPFEWIGSYMHLHLISFFRKQ
jgi:hypothetical protein